MQIKFIGTVKSGKNLKVWMTSGAKQNHDLTDFFVWEKVTNIKFQVLWMFWL